MIFFTDKNGRGLDELPATHYHDITIGEKKYPTTEACVEALAGIVNFSPGGGSPEIPEEPEETPKWQPHPDWWDIKKIFDADTDPNKRFIMLMTDSNNAITLEQAKLGNATAYYKTSDGATYNTATNTHTCDNGQDKPCGAGYKTRWVMVYSPNADVICNVATIDVIWVYIGNESKVTSFVGNGFSNTATANVILEAIECDDSVTGATNAIASYAFCDCSALVNMTIPKDVTDIGLRSFIYCFGLRNIVIPNSVTTIGDYAFMADYSLCNIDLPDSITSIGENAFQACYGVNLNIPKNVTVIKNGAFSSCYGLKKIDIPSSVTSIGTQTFMNCVNVSFVQIQNGVTAIGASAFSGIYTLRSIIIPSSVTSIGSGAFGSLNGLLSFNCELGWVACANINLTQSTKLSVTSMIDFMYNLGLNTGGAVLITLGATNMAKLTAIPEGLAAIAFATSQGYTFA